tara:strand:- start:425 stop:664 length:240 start_codon:yes stop_codon:yes gene_type:complete
MAKFNSFRAVIDAFPDRKALADSAGVEPGIVRMWRYRNSIPARHWYELTVEAKRQGIHGLDIPTLQQITPGQSAPKAVA